MFFFIGVLGIYFLQFNNDWGNQETFGWFGDFFGGTLNPILSFLTIVLLILSLKLQGDELQLSRIELAKSSDALLATLNIHSENYELQKRDLIRSEIKEAFELQYDRTSLLFDEKEIVSEDPDDGGDKFSLRQLGELMGFADALNIHPDYFSKFNTHSIEYKYFKRLCHKHLDDLVGLLTELNSKIFSEYIKTFNAERVIELVEMAQKVKIIDDSVSNSLFETIKKTHIGRVDPVNDEN